MATAMLNVIRSSIKIPVKFSSQNFIKSNLSDINFMFVRHRVTTDSGSFLPRPTKVPFGIARVLLTVVPGLYLGATISKEAAAFLEENDIFVPDEDDDED